MRKFAVLVAAAAVWLAGAGMPSAHAAFTLNDFVDSNGNSNGGSFTFNGLTFSDFSFSPVGAGVTPTPSNVTVGGYTDVLGNQGLVFGGAFTPYGTTNPADYRIAFDVTSNGAAITDVHMTGNPTVSPNGSTGSAIVTETVSGINNPSVPGLGQIQIYAINMGGGSTVSQLSDSLSFSPFQALRIQKDILVNSGTGIASISFIDQTFSTTVPEPGSVVLMGLGCLGMIGYGLKRRRSMAA